MSYDIDISVGHGVRPDGTFDPGAVGGGTSEQEAGDIVVAEMARLLTKSGFKVFSEAYSNDPNFYGSVKRINYVTKPKVAVTIHHDWSGAPQGAFGFWHPLSLKGKKLADLMLAEVKAAGFQTRDNWHKSRLLYFTRKTNPPAVLWECGRIGEYTEDQLKKMARALAQALARYFGRELTVETLVPGDVGPDVEAWQYMLRLFTRKAIPKYGIDGDFGDETDEWTRKFQGVVGLPQTGKVDQKTKDAMWERLSLR